MYLLDIWDLTVVLHFIIPGGGLLQPSGERGASQNCEEEYELTYLIAELFFTFSLYAGIARR